MSLAAVPSPRVSVLLVDDQMPFRVAARSLLEAEEAYVVVAEASDGDEAVELARRWRPDLILMDVRLPGTSGIEATRHILARDPTAVVVLLSTHSEADLPADLLTCGAAGFVRKEFLDAALLEQLLGS